MIVVLYHGNCPDGTASLAVIHKRFGDQSIMAIPFNYHDSHALIAAQLRRVNDEDLKRVSDDPRTSLNLFVLDITLQEALLRAIRRVWTHSITWIDHHLTSKRELKRLMQDDLGLLKNTEVMIDITVCAAILTHRELFCNDDTTATPAILSVVDCYDRHDNLQGWRRQLVIWNCISNPLTVDRTLELWGRALTTPAWADMTPALEASERTYDAMVANLSRASNAYCGWLFHDLKMVPTSLSIKKIFVLRVAFFDPLCEVALSKLRFLRERRTDLETPKPEFVMCVRYLGKRVVCSLRGLPDCEYDLAGIAETYGGGGHRLAASFSVESSLFQAMWNATKRSEGKME
jgi:hypothetical protein